jgi:hypothetical protein
MNKRHIIENIITTIGLFISICFNVHNSSILIEHENLFIPGIKDDTINL